VGFLVAQCNNTLGQTYKYGAQTALVPQVTLGTK